MEIDQNALTAVPQKLSLADRTPELVAELATIGA